MALEPRREAAGAAAPESSGFRRKGSMVEGKTEGRERCVAALRALSPIEDSTISMLEIPQEIHERASEAGPSFSSQPDLGIETVQERLYLGLGLPAGLPEYGIAVGMRGSSLFCTLLDKKRKIIVSEAVGNINSPGSGSWSAFASSLERAVSRASALQSEGAEFSFAVESEGSSVI